MSSIQFSFIALIAATAVYFSLRNIDLFTIVFITALIYFIPGLFNFTHDATLPITKEPLPIKLYAFYFAFFFILIVFSFNLTKEQPRRQINHPPRLLKFYLSGLRIATPITLFIAIIALNGDLFPESKQDFLDNMPFSYKTWQVLLLQYSILSIFRGKRNDRLACSAFILLDLLVGFRAVAACTLLSATVIINHDKRPSGIRSFIIYMSFIAAYTIASLYKTIVVAIKSGGLAGVSLISQDGFDIVDAIILTESFTQQAIFSRVIDGNFQAPASHLLNPFRALLPGFNVSLFGPVETFNDLFQYTLFPNVPWGMASNAWAEHYACGGWLGLVTLMLTFFLLIKGANKLLLKSIKSSPTKATIILCTTTPFIFFIHRSDLLLQITVARDSLLMYMGTIAIGFVWHAAARSSNSSERH